MDYKKVNYSQFQFGKLKKYDDNYFCHIVYEDLEPLCVKTPVLTCGTGIVKRKGRGFVDLTVPKDSKGFVDFVYEIDDICVKKAFKNSEKWFKKQIAEKDIAEAYQSIVTVAQPPTIHLVLNNLDNIFNHRGEKIPASQVKEGAEVECELEFIGIWVTSNWIGGYWELKDLYLVTPEKPLKTELDDAEIEAFKKELTKKQEAPVPKETNRTTASGGSSRDAKSESNKKSSKKSGGSKNQKEESDSYDYSDDSYYSDDDEYTDDSDYYTDDDDYYTDDYSDDSAKNRRESYESDDYYSDDDYSDDEKLQEVFNNLVYGSDQKKSDDKDDDYYTDDEESDDYYESFSDDADKVDKKENKKVKL